MPLDPSLFYTGLVAQLYSPLRSVAPDPEPYAAFIGMFGEPALELGCGDGDPLLNLRARGLDVEGLDSSADMLDRCRSAAAAQGLDVVLHHQPIETMELGRRYRSIFLAGPTFNLLPDDDTVVRALERMRAHVEPGGSALIPLFLPDATAPENLGKPREHVTPDGATMRFTAVEEKRDETARLQTTLSRYELTNGDNTATVERLWVLHWHSQDGFRGLATDTGWTVAAVLTPDGKPAAASDAAFAFLLTPAP